MIYRVPDSDVEVFNNEFTNTLETINKENKTLYSMGDYNIDVLKHEEQIKTNIFVDIIYENNLIPLITRRTQLTLF